MAADKDGDGHLEKKEWILFNNFLRDDEVKQNVIKHALEAVDANKDGMISYEEYMDDYKERVSLLETKSDFLWIVKMMVSAKHALTTKISAKQYFR